MEEVAEGQRRGPRGRSFYLSKRQLGYILISPSFFIVFCVLFYPLIYSIVISFQEIDLAKPDAGTPFVGFGNYWDTIRRPEFWSALARTAYFVLFDIVVGMSLGLAIALLLNQKFRLRGVVRGLIILPYVLPGVVNGLIWRWIYNPDFGFLNAALLKLGLIPEYIAWLGQPWLALHMLILANIWQGTPFGILLYLAGLQTIPQDLYDAARVDGATRWQTLIRVTLPLLLPISLVLMVLKTIATFKIFDIVYILTGGGPADATQVVSYYIYNESFVFLHLGAGAAMSYVLTLVVLVLVYAYYKLLGTEVIY
ncbi:MAG: carbohydrate ABC transporter permease [bacterium]